MKGNMGNSHTQGSYWLALRGHMLPWSDNTYTLGDQYLRWKEVWAVDNTINTSDETLKRDIVPDDLGLEFIRSLRPVVWRWNDDKEDHDHRGFVAQDVRRALRELPDRRGFAGLVDRGGPLGLRMAEFIGPLVKAVQELDARCARLEDDTETTCSPNASASVNPR